jgi:hypothetical protein
VSNSKATAKKATAPLLTLPDNMVTKIFSVKTLGEMIAESSDLPTGQYDLVVEFKFGSVNLKSESDAAVPAMAMGLGGLGLRKADSEGPMTIHYAGKAQKKKSPKKDS